jgi:hypothetical protein
MAIPRGADYEKREPRPLGKPGRGVQVKLFKLSVAMYRSQIFSEGKMGHYDKDTKLWVDDSSGNNTRLDCSVFSGYAFPGDVVAAMAGGSGWICNSCGEFEVRALLMDDLHTSGEENAQVYFFNGSNWSLTSNIIQVREALGIHRNAVQDLSVDPSATSGAFTLKVNNQVTPSLPYDATAQQIANVMMNMGAVGSNNVLAFEGPLPENICRFEFFGTLANTPVDTMIFQGSGGLTGLVTNVQVAGVIEAGSIILATWSEHAQKWLLSNVACGAV